MTMRYWATRRKEGYMMNLCALVKQVRVMKRAMMMKIEIMMKIVMMMMTAMVMESDLLIKPGTYCACDWAHVFNFCYCPQLQPLKCATVCCDKFVHQICQNAFEQRHGHSVTTLLKCCVHHPHSPFTATKLLTSNVEEEQQPEHVSNKTSSEELSSSSKSSESSSSLSSSDDDSSDSNAVQPLTRKGWVFAVSGKEQAIWATMQAQRGKVFSFQCRFGMLPTANNRANNSNTRGLDTQFEYRHIFTTFACHKLPEDLGRLKKL